MLDLNRYSMAARILALKMTGQVGPRAFQTLLTHFKTVDNILLAEKEEFEEIDGIGPVRSRALFEADTHLDKAQSTVDNLEASDTGVVTCFDDAFPEMLHELNDPPPLLYYQGRLPQADEKRVAIIGSQAVSAEGIGDAVKFAKHLAREGVAIIGGLARGIDAAGHTGALKADGATFAALPCGFNQIYPPENTALSREITRRGGLISEYLPDIQVADGRLLARNRLTIALSQAVVIGEVAPDSVGTMDAALCCHQLGKLLFVIVGQSNPHYDQLAAFGAVPLTNINECGIILKSLV